jgi:hypothetical protein
MPRAPDPRVAELQTFVAGCRAKLRELSEIRGALYSIEPSAQGRLDRATAMMIVAIETWRRSGATRETCIALIDALLDAEYHDGTTTSTRRKKRSR